MKPWFRLPTLGVLFLLWQGALSAQPALLPDMLNKVPAEANALILIDVQALHNSPLGRKEAWAKRHATDFLGGKVPFPPGASMVLFATHLDWEPAGAGRSWELGLVSLTKSVSLTQIAQYEHGIFETVAGQQVLLTPRRLYIAPLTTRLMAVQAPAHRQELGRWLQFCQRNKSPVVADWLRETAAELDKTGQCVFALHLEDAVDPRQVRQELTSAQVHLPAGTELEGLVQAMASIKGLRLAFLVKDEIQGELRIEFNKPVKPYASVLHPLLAFGFRTLGDGLPNLKEWTMEVNERTVTFRSPVPTETFANLLEAIQPQTTPASLGTEDGTAPQGDKAFAARRYFQQVTRLQEELNKRTAALTDYDLAALAYQNYAQRIDRLPVYGMDENLVQYANNVSNKLRAMAQSLSGVPITAAMLEAAKREVFVYQPPRYVNTGFFWARRFRFPVWGGGMYIPEQVYYASNLPELRGKLAQAIAKDRQNRVQLWRTIEEDTTRIRQKMTTKYGVEFGP